MQQIADYRGPLPDVLNCPSGMSPELTRVSLRSLQGGAKMRDPGNEVGCHVYLPAYFRSYAFKLSQGDYSLNNLSFSVNQREPNSHVHVTKFCQ